MVRFFLSTAFRVVAPIKTEALIREWWLLEGGVAYLRHWAY